MSHPFFFATLSALMIASALGVILSRNPVNAVLLLVSTLFALSGLFVLLGAYFVAAIQIIVYAGAILVLFLFVVMLLEMAPEKLLQIRGSTWRAGGLLFGLFFLWQILRVAGAAAPAAPPVPAAAPGTTEAIGRILFTTYALPFEVASGLLLVGIIGAVVLAKKRVP